MTKEKGLPDDVANRIGKYVKLNGGKDLVATLEGDSLLCSQPSFKAGLNDLKLLLEYCELMGIIDKVREGRGQRNVAYCRKTERQGRRGILKNYSER